MATAPVWTLIVYAVSGSVVVDDIASEEEAVALGEAIQAHVKAYRDVSPPYNCYPVLKEFGPLNPAGPKRRRIRDR